MNEARLAVGAATDVGRERSVNEDSHGFVRASIGDVLIVCDGMGGHAAGDIASKVARDALIRSVMETQEDNAQAVLYDAIQAAQTAVRASAAESLERSGMGTTCVVAIVQDRNVWVGNVGDSRGYILRQSGVLEQVSKDQTKGQELVDADLITEEALQTHPLQSVLSQALGQEKEIQPFIVNTTIAEGETILLCSDGVYDEPSDTQIAELIAIKDPGYASANLVAYATDVDGKDNATAVIGRYMEADTNAAPISPAPAPEVPEEPQGVSLSKKTLIGGAVGIALCAAGITALIMGLCCGAPADEDKEEDGTQTSVPVDKPDTEETPDVTEDTTGDENNPGGSSGETPGEEANEEGSSEPEEKNLQEKKDRKKAKQQREKRSRRGKGATRNSRRNRGSNADGASRVTTPSTNPTGETKKTEDNSEKENHEEGKEEDK